MEGIMKQKFRAALLGICVLMYTGCDGSLFEPDDLDIPPPEDTGRGELTLDEGLALYSMTDEVENATTQETLGRGEDGKYRIKGPVISNSNLNASGFADAMFVYYDSPLAGEFKMRARIRMTEYSSKSTSKGFFFGIFTGKEGGNFDAMSRGGGLLYRTNENSAPNSGKAAIRGYKYTSAGSWSAGTNDSSATDYLNHGMPGWNSEVIMEFTRTEASIFMEIFNSKTGASEASLTITDDDLHQDTLAYGKPVYAGVALLATSLEFSEFDVWDSAAPGTGTSGNLIHTPATSPAYVPVEGVTIQVKLNGGSLVTPPAHSTLPNTSTYTASFAGLTSLELSPVFEPGWADNTHVDWNVVSWTPDGTNSDTAAPSLSTDSAHNRALVQAAGKGKALILVTSRDPNLPPDSVLETLADYSLELIFN
jgi:hypothetical protein